MKTGYVLSPLLLCLLSGLVDLQQAFSFNNKQGPSHLAKSSLTMMASSKAAKKTPPPKKSGGSSKAAPPINEFVQWAERAGITSERARPANIDGLRGMVAAQKISAGTDFIAVPNAVAITTTTDQANPMPDLLAGEDWARAKWYLRLALLLCREAYGPAPPGAAAAAAAAAAAGEGAAAAAAAADPRRLGPYLDQLPRPQDFNTPYHWDDEDLEKLNYPYLQQQVVEQRRNWTALIAGLRRTSPDLPFTEEQVVWGMECAYSRTFSGPYEGRGARERRAEVAFVALLAIGSYALGLANENQIANGAFSVLLSIPLRDFFTSKLLKLKRYAMCPMIDFINHKSTVESDVSYNYFKDHFSVFTRNDFEEGEQIFISYGKKSNDYLLQYYGFVEEDNPYDDYVLTSLPDLAAKAAEAGAIDPTRLELVQETGLLGALREVTFQRDGSFDEYNVMKPLRLLFLSDEELATKGGAGVMEAAAEAVSPGNEDRCRAFLAGALRAEAAGYGKDAAQARAAVRKLGDAAGAGARLAAQFRAEKLRVLGEVVRAVGAQ